MARLSGRFGGDSVLYAIPGWLVAIAREYGVSVVRLIRLRLPCATRPHSTTTERASV